MDPCIPDSRLGFHESFTRDHGELEECHYQVNEMVTKVDGLSQKLKEVEQFFSTTNNQEDNTSKPGSILKDKDKDKLIENLMQRQQDVPHKEAAATKKMLDLMRQFGTIITQITQHKWAVPFMKPVDVVGLGLHDYYEIIEKPMDFSTIKKKMDCKDGSGYKHVRDIWVDVRLIFKNAMKYNDEKHDVHEMARYLLAKFEEKWLNFIYPKIVDELQDKLQVEEQADTQLYTRLTQEVAHAKMARDLSNELDEIDLHLEEFKGLVLQRCRKMSTEEKRRLATALTKLPPDDLNEALMIVAEDNPCFQASATEVDLDIDSQGELTLWKLKFFLKDKMQAARDNSNHNHNNGISANDTNNTKPVAGANKNNNSLTKRKREFCDAIAIAKNLQKKAKETPLQMHHSNNNNPRKS